MLARFEKAEMAYRPWTGGARDQVHLEGSWVEPIRPSNALEELGMSQSCAS